VVTTCSGSDLWYVDAASYHLTRWCTDRMRGDIPFPSVSVETKTAGREG
jgi:hypothetical protein